MIKLSLLISGMRCEQCVQTIEAAVRALPGVTDCDVRVGAAEVAFGETATDKARLIAAIRQAGPFDVTDFHEID